MQSEIEDKWGNGQKTIQNYKSIDKILNYKQAGIVWTHLTQT